MERSQIVSERRLYIENAQHSDDNGFAIQQSNDVYRAKAQLGVGDRVKVEEQIFLLASDANPDTANADENGESRTMTIPGTSLEIVFAVDQESHCIRIFSLRLSDESE